MLILDRSKFVLARGHGFTLLEIIVVIIITGVLLAVAFPTYHKLIENCRNLEADSTDGLIADAIIRCRHFRADPTYDCPANQLDMDITALPPGSHWTYSLRYPVGQVDPDCGLVDFAVVARRNFVAGGDGVRQRILVSGVNGCRIFRDDEAGTCFIATAVYGDPDMEQVVLLRKFRDDVLMANRYGRSFVRYYYRYGPYWAKKVNNSLQLKFMARAVLDGVVHLIESP